MGRSSLVWVSRYALVWDRHSRLENLGKAYASMRRVEEGL